MVRVAIPNLQMNRMYIIRWEDEHQRVTKTIFPSWFSDGWYPPHLCNCSE